MSNEFILKELNVLPEHLKIQVFNYIRFLKSPFVVSASQTVKKPKFGFGKYKVEISEDFDAPLEDFKDYM
ncbi:MAG TPA: DUF2281 domain-containing protein [Saprospiraceae bacterium]|nr:DUF2281 domain-containing protein [Saprospiraceae bacterium]HRF42281.1 DUF2281 domain-containing protein [Saprospiraceae bacterium]HRK80067.1 DUF2281 domain-containing protein [Saprospiraceae bacterium]